MQPTEPLTDEERERLATKLLRRFNQLKHFAGGDDVKANIREHTFFLLGVGTVYQSIFNGTLVHKDSKVAMHTNTVTLCTEMENLINRYAEAYPDQPK